MKAVKVLLLTLGLAGLLASPSCLQIELNEEVPACIEHMIKQRRRAAVQNPPAEVWKWEVDGRVYYYFTGDCCDQFNELYDSECNYVCAPDGGVGGQGDGQCPVFGGPIEKSLIWQDPRK